jgi:uncharacterized protein (TIGR03435 family)
MGIRQLSFRTGGQQLLLLMAVALATMGTTAACAQSSMPPRLLGADGKPLEFDVVSVRPDRSGDEAMNIVSPPMGDGMTITNMPLENIIGWAYGLTIRNQVSGMPDWAKKERFDIKAKVADEDLAAFRKVLDPIVRVSMLQKILVDRFKMSSHYETRMLAGYVLVVGKNGAKLTEVEPPIGPDGMKDGGHRRVARGEYESFGMWMLPLVRQLMQELGCVVVDKTNLHGYYNYTLKWTPDDGQPPGDTAGSTSGPSIFTAVQEQLGLKLEPTKVPTQVLVIDSIERPSDN